MVKSLLIKWLNNHLISKLELLITELKLLVIQATIWLTNHSTSELFWTIQIPNTVVLFITHSNYFVLALPPSPHKRLGEESYGTPEHLPQLHHQDHPQPLQHHRDQPQSQSLEMRPQLQQHHQDQPQTQSQSLERRPQPQQLHQEQPQTQSQSLEMRTQPQQHHQDQPQRQSQSFERKNERPINPSQVSEILDAAAELRCHSNLYSGIVVYSGDLKSDHLKSGMI